MADTKRGRLATKALGVDTNETVYSVTTGNDATVNICISNTGSGPCKVSVAVVDGLLADLTADDYIRHRTVIGIGEVLEIKDLKMSNGEILVTNANRSGAVVRVSGIEEGVIV